MPSIDITVSPELEEMFQLPSCADIKLPPPSPITIQLPGGGTLSSISDLSKGVPTDCAMVFSLLIQIGPFLASIECLVKVLKLVQTVVDTLKSISSPFDLVNAIPKIIKAAEPVVECALSFTPAGLIPFIRDLLCLLLKVLRCFLSQMKSLLNILNETVAAINAATAAGNDELVASLTCAQNNALTQGQQLTASLAALGVILDLSSDLMQIVGVPPIAMPAMGQGADLNALNEVVQTVETLVATLQTAVDLLGGCQ